MATQANALNERIYFENISATTDAFLLKGGYYGIDVVGSSFGTVTLEKLSGDGSNYVTALEAFDQSAYATVLLAPGTYRVAISSTTGVYFNMVAIARAA